MVASFTSLALVSTLAAAESNFTFAESRATLAESTFALTAESTSLTASLVSDFLQATNARAATAATNNDFFIINKFKLVVLKFFVVQY